MLTRSELDLIVRLIAELDALFAMNKGAVLAVDAKLYDSNGESIGTVSWNPATKSHVLLMPGESL
jgi:hypothetical protein